MEVASEHVNAVRRFTRFYTRKIRALHEGMLGSPYSLTEGRLIYEVAQRGTPVASELGKDLGLDPGYLSRVLRSFRERGLIDRQSSPTDGRQSLLSLTPAGRAGFEAIDRRSREEVGAIVAGLSRRDRERLVRAMRIIEDLLASEIPKAPAFVLRAHRPSDMGWVIHRQAALYYQEYGWDESFEALVAEICAAFIKGFDPEQETCWIAELDGEVVGSVFLVEETDKIAKLRLLYAEPTVRGLGLGRRLVRECIGFAREAGYRTLTLWTNDILHAARKIYQAEGFRLVAEERHRSFGHDLVGQNWELEL